MLNRTIIALAGALLMGAGDASAQTVTITGTSAVDLRAIALKAKAAFERGYKKNGIGGEMHAIRTCYARLRPESPPSLRAYCLLLDLSAFRFEQALPEQYRQTDERLDDYLSASKFGARARANVSPLTGDLTAKVATYKAIEAAYDAD